MRYFTRGELRCVDLYGHIVFLNNEVFWVSPNVHSPTSKMPIFQLFSYFFVDGRLACLSFLFFLSFVPSFSLTFF